MHLYPGNCHCQNSAAIFAAQELPLRERGERLGQLLRRHRRIFRLPKQFQLARDRTDSVNDDPEPFVSRFAGKDAIDKRIHDPVPLRLQGAEFRLKSRNLRRVSLAFAPRFQLAGHPLCEMH